MLAVVLAVPPPEVDHSVLPDQTVAGLSLTLRAVLTLLQQGAERLVLVVPEGDTRLAQAIVADRRVAADRVQVLELPPGGRLWSELAGVVDEPFWMARYDVVAKPSLYPALAGQATDDSIGVLASREGVALGPLWGTPELLAAAGETEALGALMDRADVASWDVGEHRVTEEYWVAEAGSPSGRREILRRLLGDCRKSVDGLVSRHLNRHVSLWVSRLLVNTPVTPNMMTGVTFAVGLVAVWFVVQGGYQATLIGALLMQLNSILDGCDGELARMRFQGSKLGQWLDTLGDDVSNILYWAALGFGALELGGPWAFWLALCGWVAAGANLLAAIQWYGLLRGLGSGDLNAIPADDEPPKPGFVGSVVRFFSLVLKQDFFIFFLACLALAGVIHQTLPLFALGAIVTLGAATVRTARAWARRRAGHLPNNQ